MSIDQAMTIGAVAMLVGVIVGVFISEWKGFL